MAGFTRTALRRTVGCLLSGLLLAGCGAAKLPPPGPPVSLTLLSPADGTRLSTSRATISGRVHPASAHLEVLGQTVRPRADGDFSTSVALTHGANLIDVIASEPRSIGAVAAVRITQFLLVTVPSVLGESPQQARDALRDLGLGSRVESSSDPLDFLIPASTQVCSSTPAPGIRVDPGTTVTLTASKLCGF